MKALLLAVAVASSVLIATSLFYTSTAKNAAALYEEDALIEFNQWMMFNGKAYGTETDKDYRFGVFKNNRDIVKFNSENPNSTYSLLELKTGGANLKFNLWKLSHIS